VQSDILEKYASADLEVYVVWMPMLATDARSKWDPAHLSDRRVRHFWDEERTAGLWFARAGVGGLGYAGVVWDAYLLFGPDASWDDEPAPLVGAGAPVVAKSAQLEAEVGRLVAG